MRGTLARLSQRPALAGGLAGLAAFATGHLLLAVLIGAPPADQPVAAQALFATNNLWLIAFMASVWAPVFETAAAQWLPIELLRRAGAPSTVRLLASAVVFSGGHMLNGGGVLQGQSPLYSAPSSRRFIFSFASGARAARSSRPGPAIA